MTHDGRSRTVVATLTALVLVVAAACASGPGDGGARTVAPWASPASLDRSSPPLEPAAPPQWDDGYEHLIVIAEQRTEPLLQAAPSGGGLARVLTPSEPPGPVALRHPDGSVELIDTTGMFVVIARSDEAEIVAALEERFSVAFVVEVPGRGRFVWAGGELYDVASWTGTALHQTLHQTVDQTWHHGGGPTTDPSDEEPVSQAGVVGRSAETQLVADDVLAAALEAVDGVVDVELIAPGMFKVRTTGDSADLESIPGVEDVFEDLLMVFAADPRESEQWFIENTGAGSQAGGWPGVAGADVDAPASWQVATGVGRTIAIIDSGYEIDHPDLAPNLWTNTGEVCGNGQDDDGNGFVDDCLGWDFGGGDNDVRPDPAVTTQILQHGTHVASVAGSPRNGVGGVGVAPGARLMLLKVSNGNDIAMSSVVAAIYYAVDNGADVINLSLATTPGTPRNAVAPAEAAIAHARTHGVVVVAGSGNDGIDITATPVWPAGFSQFYDNVITVGATTNSDTLASFSNTGTPVNLLAPGFWMLAAVPGGYTSLSGTSMAAPVVAGAAAVLLSSGQVSTPAQVRQRLVDTADVIAAGARVNMASAVGAGALPVVDVAYSGFGDLRPGVAATVATTVATTVGQVDDPHLRLTVASREGGQVVAVEGLHAELSDGGGPIGTDATDGVGALEPVSVRDPQALAGAGYTVSAHLTLPEGEYAFVTEVLDGDGGVVGGAHVAFVHVSDQPVAPPPGTVPADPVPENPVTTTTVPSGATTTTTLAEGGGGGGGGGAVPPTTVADGGGDGGAPHVTVPPTTVPAAPSTTVPPGAPDPDQPGTTQPDAGQPGTSTPPPSETTAPATTTPPTTAPAGPGGPPPPTTTPQPDPVFDGDYAFVDMTPRWSPTTGGVTTQLDGVFPTTVPVYVWFGDRVVPGAVSEGGARITAVTPSVTSDRVTDVSVRFTTSQSWQLTLVDAFTFGEPEEVPPTTAPPGGGAPTTSSTVPAAASTTTTTTPATTTTTTAPVPPPPGGGPGDLGAPRIPGEVVGERDGLVLRSAPSAGPVAQLASVSWTACSAPTCPATRLP